MKAQELRELTVEELDKRLNETAESYFNLRVRATTKELENTAQIRNERRTIGRIKTILREKRSQA